MNIFVRFLAWLGSNLLSAVLIGACLVILSFEAHAVRPDIQYTPGLVVGESRADAEARRRHEEAMREQRRQTAILERMERERRDRLCYRDRYGRCVITPR